MSLLKFIEQKKYNTDKLDLGYIHEFYDQLLSKRKNNAKKLLEIGMSGGESILLWRDFFQSAEIHAVDINVCNKLNNQSRIKTFYGNAYSKDIFDNFEKNTYDIVIDDGPHTYETMCYFIDHYINLINEQGVAILEDIVDVSWTKLLVDKIDKNIYTVEVVNMAKKQRTKHHNELWKNGLDVLIIKKKLV